MTHNESIIDHLENIGSITPLDALIRYGCFRLAARVFELRGKGHDIIGEREGNHFRYQMGAK